MVVADEDDDERVHIWHVSTMFCYAAVSGDWNGSGGSCVELPSVAELEGGSVVLSCDLSLIRTGQSELGVVDRVISYTSDWS